MIDQARRDPAPSRIAICVPVRNEAARLPALFAALEALDGVSHADLCLLLDGCTDGSAACIADYRARSRLRLHVSAVPAGEPNAGLARHRAMRLGMDVLGAAGGILLTTDADSCPRPDWIAATVAGLEHADVVAGKVVREREVACPDQDRIEAYFEELFALRRRLDPVAWEAPVTHHHGSGANMGLRSETYAQAGGFLPLASGEDAQFLDDAARAGLRVRRDAASVVLTSDRRRGRAAGGMAEKLRELDRDGLAGVTVAHPADAAWQYRMQAAARQAFAVDDLNSVSPMLGLDADHLLGVARDCRNAEAFAMRVVATPPGGMRTLPFAAAEAALAAMSAPAEAVQAA